MKRAVFILSILVLVFLFSGTAFYLKTTTSATTQKITTPPSKQIESLGVTDDTIQGAVQNIAINPFEEALQEISQMLNGEKSMNFKRAVFLTENAYYNGMLDWDEFCNEIEQIKKKLNQMIASRNLQHHKTAGNWAIFTYMTDSIPENNFHPYTYDLDNYMGGKNYDAFMVSKLLKTRKGNCHSLPYLYKILAHEMNVEAFLATAPMHIYIRHRDETGKWWNLELTTASFSRTSFIMESFNVSDAGMESGLYMKALSLKESLAFCLHDLLVYFDKKTGIYYGDFVRRTCTIGLKYYPNSLLQLLKATDQKYPLDEAMDKKGISDYRKIKNYPDLVELDKAFQATKEYINKIGFSTLTTEQYQEKLVEVEKRKQMQTIHSSQIR